MITPRHRRRGRMADSRRSVNFATRGVIRRQPLLQVGADRRQPAGKTA